jgi:heparan-alpha-glucosaminide N-acetyltransferase
MNTAESAPASPLGPVPPARPGGRRLDSIDAYRGLVMFLMLAEVLHFCQVAKAVPGHAVWAFLCRQQSHVEWVGCTLHDLIQPSFSFLVGVALVFSLANREARGQSLGRMTLHAFWRGLVLVALGIFLRSLRSNRTNYTFEDTLTQIGLGYPFLFLLGLRPRRDQWIALVLILVGIWAAFALRPLPPSDFDYASVGVSSNWLAEHGLHGFAAHWQKNSNLAWAFDRWFLNLLPRERPFTHNGGGYATLSFIPTLATMILGLIAGGWLREGYAAGRPGATIARLSIAGLIGLATGWGLDAAGVCPLVKRIWTPSWVLFSGGWCFLFLAGFHAVIEGAGLRAWAFPLRVIGRNSIAAYLFSWLFEGFIAENLTRHLGEGAFRVFGDAYEPLLHGAAVLIIMWLILFWMDRRKIYLKI